MKRRKFISAVPAAILLAQRPSAAIAQTRKKGVMLMNRIGSSSSQLYPGEGLLISRGAGFFADALGRRTREMLNASANGVVHNIHWLSSKRLELSGKNCATARRYPCCA